MSDKQNLVVPELGESITEAVIGRWLKNVGDAVAADEPVVDLETDKITVQLPAPAAGVLSAQHAAEGDTVEVGDVVGEIAAGAAAASTQASAPAAAAPSAPAPAPAAPAPAPAPSPQPTAAAPSSQIDQDALLRLTPAQRRAARKGEPVPAKASSAPAPASPPRPAASAPPSAPGTAHPREEAVRMSPLRKRIAERLVQVQQETASLTTFNEVDMSAIMALRSEHKQDFLDTHGTKLGFMSFFAKACVTACQRFPGLNAEVRGNEIVYKKHYDFGIAVSTERGLVVPVLRDVDTMSFADIESGIVDLATRARNGKLGLADLTGGTFTLTNGGIFGSMLSTPILNYPQTGILGMHNIVRRPVAIGDSIEIRPIMYVALSYDHRVVDGRQAVHFLVTVKDRLEKPDRLLLGI